MTAPLQSDERLIAAVRALRYPLLFVSVSGAHLYGFPSQDSDYDLRGAHVLPVRDVIQLQPGEETAELSEERNGFQLDLVTHDIKKYFSMVLKKNGYVLEQIFSPLVVYARPEFEELREIARKCVTRHHAHHYFGFYETQWKLFSKDNPRRVKRLLYVYRGLLTGIHLMRTGEVEANLNRLNESFKLPYIPELINLKVCGTEKSTLSDVDNQFHESESRRLRELLETAAAETKLREKPLAQAALNDLLVQLRLANV